MKRPRDYQKNKLYQWEKFIGLSVSGPSDMTLAECQLLVQQIFIPRGFLTCAVVKDGRRRRYPCFAPGKGRGQIKLPVFARRRWLVIHEAAHALTEACGKDQKFSWHGATFVKIYIDLLAEFVGMDGRDLAASARAFGLKCHPTAAEIAYQDALTAHDAFKAQQKPPRVESLFTPTYLVVDDLDAIHGRQFLALVG